MSEYLNKIETNYSPVDTISNGQFDAMDIESTPENNAASVPGNINWKEIAGIDIPEDLANKREIFAQNAVPTGDYKEGDLWFDTDDSNHIYRADADLNWVSVQDGSIFDGNWSEIIDDDGNKPADNADVTAANNNWSEVTDDDTNKPDNNATVGAEFGTNVSGGGAANTQVSNAGYTTLFRQTIFGNGASGSASYTSNAFLTSDMYFENLTLSNNMTLETRGYKLFIKGTLTIESGSAISGGIKNGADGADGDAAGGGAGGAGATLYTGTMISTGGKDGGDGSDGISAGANGDSGAAQGRVVVGDGKDGGAGGDCANYNGGTGGVAGASTLTKMGLKNALEAITFFDFSGTYGALIVSSRGGGGGGGAGEGSSAGGGGGGGAGGSGIPVMICAKTIVNSGTIKSEGGDGGDGGDAYAPTPAADSAGGGGGGGGGIGGVIILVYEVITLGTTSVIGGNGGTGGAAANPVGGSGQGTAGTDGVDGGAGELIEINI